MKSLFGRVTRMVILDWSFLPLGVPYDLSDFEAVSDRFSALLSWLAQSLCITCFQSIAKWNGYVPLICYLLRARSHSKICLWFFAFVFSADSSCLRVHGSMVLVGLGSQIYSVLLLILIRALTLPEATTWWTNGLRWKWQALFPAWCSGTRNFFACLPCEFTRVDVPYVSKSWMRVSFVFITLNLFKKRWRVTYAAQATQEYIIDSLGIEMQTMFGRKV